ncbi:FkbM family methyltransferase [Ancylobacter sp. G4_0304]|uniref:FkbM family methyltransferase n=1 Tax=Ancylobacter sp. G4_0304 TaxID=3114289 RepID=UPI0039C6E755
MHPTAPPVDEHYFDWIGLLTAVARADGVFRMAELGAGWAPWLVRAALASRQRPQITGLELLAIEADPAHHSWIIQHFLDNDIDPVEHSIVHGAVSSRPGMLSFPAVVDPDIDYGASLRGTALATDTIEVRGWSVPEVLARFSGPLDFLHVDIQGAEYDSLPAAMDALKASVKSIMIGTHHPDSSHDALLATFRDHGWREVLVFPRNSVNQTPWGEIKTNDGFLLFENPDFVASAG